MASQDFDQLHSQIDTTVHTNGPTGKTTATGLNALLHRLVTDLPASTSLPAEQLVALAAATNPNASNPYATIADIAGLPDGGGLVTVEQDLISSSTTSVPSVAAVRAAADAANCALEAIRTTLPATDVRATDYTLQLADAGQQVPIDSPGAGNVIVPADSVADFAVGAIVEVSQENTGQVTIAGQPGVTIQAPGGAVRTAMQYGIVGLRKVAPNVWRVQGGVN